MLCSLPVPRSFADTWTIPFASMSKVTSICGIPLCAGGIPIRSKLLNHFYPMEEIMNNENQNLKSVDDIVTEQELLELLGIKKGALDDLRYRHQLPVSSIVPHSALIVAKDGLIPNGDRDGQHLVTN